MALRSWKIKGNDGHIYIVEERAGPGIGSNPISGRTTYIPSGTVEYVLADGSDVLNENPGEWTTLNGVAIKQPNDL